MIFPSFIHSSWTDFDDVSDATRLTATWQEDKTWRIAYEHYNHGISTASYTIADENRVMRMLLNAETQTDTFKAFCDNEDMLDVKRRISLSIPEFQHYREHLLQNKTAEANPIQSHVVTIFSKLSAAQKQNIASLQIT
jgi:hypothetical protein